jgi:hypothetical protein
VPLLFADGSLSRTLSNSSSVSGEIVQNFNGLNFENVGPQNSVEHTGDSNVRTRTFNASLTTVLRPTLFKRADD